MKGKKKLKKPVFEMERKLKVNRSISSKAYMFNYKMNHAKFHYNFILIKGSDFLFFSFFSFFSSFSTFAPNSLLSSHELSYHSRQTAAIVSKWNKTNGVHTYETYNATKKDIKKYRKRKKAGAMMAHLYILWVVLH